MNPVQHLGFIAHRALHFYAGLALMVATLAMMGAVRNRHLRRRLLISFIGWLLFIAMHLVMNLPSLYYDGEVLQHIEILLFGFSAIAAAVALAFNSWWKENVERAPAIVQDALALFLLSIVSVVVFHDSVAALGASAATGIVLGFAFQETLGNIFAGLWYPVIVAGLTLIIGTLFIREKMDKGGFHEV